MGETKAASVRVFISYAHEDTALKQQLDKFLKALKRSTAIESWSDSELAPGQDFDASIAAELRSADVILLLVSVDFIASDYIWDRELAVAMERHRDGSARVIPVILRPCDWSSMPFAGLQALPAGATPVTDHDDQDAAFTEIAAGLDRVVHEFLRKRTGG